MVDVVCCTPLATHSFSTSVMRVRRLIRWILRRLARSLYPDEPWLQEKSKDQYQRNWRRWSRYPDPGPAFDLIVILSCVVLAIACLFV
jgi:hypothetical protein